MILTKEYCMGATRGASPQNITKLNLWGCEIENIDCIKEFPNLKVLSMSINNISSLAACGYCNNLEEIFIRHNKISDWKELDHLKGLPRLKILWLKDNPLCRPLTSTEYRTRVISLLPNLLKIDEHDVTPEEREAGKVIANANKPAPKINSAVKDAGMDALSESQHNLVKGLCVLMQNMDLATLEFLNTEVSMRMQEVAGKGGPM